MVSAIAEWWFFALHNETALIQFALFFLPIATLILQQWLPTSVYCKYTVAQLLPITF